MTYPITLKTKARLLRRQGRSILDIAATTGLAKSTVSLWVSDVPLRPELDAVLKGRKMTGAAEGRRMLAGLRALKQEGFVKEAKGCIAMNAIDTVSFWRLSAAQLFWCEGSKDLSRLIFTNSDPALMATFIRSLRLGFGVDERKFRALLHLHEYHDPETQVAYWSRITGIPSVKFNKTYLKPHTGKRKRDGYQGCLSLRYGDASLAQKLSALYHAFAQLSA